VEISIPAAVAASNLALSGAETGLAGSSNLFSSAVRMVSALAITLGILFFMVYLVRWFFARGGAAVDSRGLMRVISRTYLGNKQSLVLADIAGEKVVLGLSPQSITLLAKIDSKESLERIAGVEGDPSVGRPFVWYLESIMAKRLKREERNRAKP